ncbi:hypothetical protein PNOK_0024400 [Pyrrhoderma noxium]|uniref:Uncharacterized protein n=1 Tax=Pyrrhoderma noxium TaxID=2282107 RepID=A0A286UU95_9AGAM|nr:hypothetical protein PNOK_0024400 [Pyrrhoderma noxium]
MSARTPTLCPNCCALLELIHIVTQIYAQQTISVSQEHQGSRNNMVSAASRPAKQQLLSDNQRLLSGRTDIAPDEDTQIFTNITGYNGSHLLNQCTALVDFSSRAQVNQDEFFGGRVYLLSTLTTMGLVALLTRVYSPSISYKSPQGDSS